MMLIPFKRLEQRSYFFDQGLRFTCLKCGACCVGEPGTIYVTQSEIETISASLQQPVEAFTAQYLYPYKDSYSIKEDKEGRCLFFDDGCTIYDIRPLQCRTFPCWFSSLRSERLWRDIQSQCPGIGRGRLYSREELLELAAKTIPF